LLYAEPELKGSKRKPNIQVERVREAACPKYNTDMRALLLNGTNLKGHCQQV
jgi:hypothetical protein